MQEQIISNQSYQNSLFENRVHIHARKQVERQPLTLKGVALRPYQQDAIAAVMAARDRGLQRVLYTAPTGTGKTTVFVGILAAMGIGRPALILAHREELLTQAAERIRLLLPGVVVTAETGANRASRGSDVVVASIQALGRKGCDRLGWLEPGLIICDEAHHVCAAGYIRTFERFGCYRNGGPFLVGTTATPKRLDRLNLKTVFEDHVFDYPIRQAMEDGYLCDVRGYSVVTQTDLRGVRTTAGDYNQAELSRAVNTEQRTQSALKHWLGVAPERKTIIFCVTVEHAKAAAETWRKAGIAAQAVHGDMDPRVRRELMSRFRAGEVQVLTNCEICTEGLDVPDTSCIVMLRPTKSWALFVQMVGRGLRPVKPDCVVIDLVDNTDRNNLASVPAILDLPPGINLEGRTLKETAKKMEQLTEGAAFLHDYQPETFTELETMLRTVDLFGRVTPTPEVSAHSRLAWLYMPGDYYRLSLPPKRIAEIRKDGLGRWHTSFSESGQLVFSPQSIESLTESLRTADKHIEAIWPDSVALAYSGGKWRRDGATEKQRAALKQLGQRPEVIDRLNKGEASSMISMLRAGARSGQ